MPKTLFDKIWDAHEVGEGLIYVDLHLVHEVTSPQAFEGLRLAGRKVRRPDKTIATADHNVPTDGTPAARLIADELSRKPSGRLPSASEPPRSSTFSPPSAWSRSARRRCASTIAATCAPE